MGQVEGKVAIACVEDNRLAIRPRELTRRENAVRGNLRPVFTFLRARLPMSRPITAGPADGL